MSCFAAGDTVLAGREGAADRADLQAELSAVIFAVHVKVIVVITTVSAVVIIRADDLLVLLTVTLVTLGLTILRGLILV